MGEAEYRPFERRISGELLATLSKEALFTGKIKADIGGSVRAKSRVFPAIRQERVDFYYRGGKLFSFDRAGFRTNLKYATGVEEGETLRSEVREADLDHLRRITNFTSGYPTIKALCSLYAGDEARAVSELWGQFSFAVPGHERLPVVILDVEASFDARVRDEAENQQDRIDLVLLNTLDKSLMFVEAKLFSNSAIRAAAGSVPEIVGQVARYRQQVAQQQDCIIGAYRSYVIAMNGLLSLSIPQPESVVAEVPLLIVGFDNDQRQGRLSLNMSALAEHGVRCLSIGDPAAALPNTMKKWYEQATSTSARSV